MVTLHSTRNTGPSGSTLSDYRLTVLREAANLMCEACSYSLPMLDEFNHDGSKYGKAAIECEAWKIRAVLDNQP